MRPLCRNWTFWLQLLLCPRGSASTAAACESEMWVSICIGWWPPQESGQGRDKGLERGRRNSSVQRVPCAKLAVVRDPGQEACQTPLSLWASISAFEVTVLGNMARRILYILSTGGDLSWIRESLDPGSSELTWMNHMPPWASVSLFATWI